MVSLAAAVSATQREWQVSAPFPAGTRYVLAGSELVQIMSARLRPAQLAKPFDPPRYAVRRGVVGARATHAQGVTLTPYYDQLGTAALDTGSASGGVSLPDGWDSTNDADALRIKQTAGGIFQLQLEENTDTGLVASFNSDPQVAVNVQVETDGVDGTANLSVFNNDTNGTSNLDARGALNLFTVPDVQAIEAWDAEGTTLRFALLPAGQMMTGVVAAPADGDLSPSQCAFWFDDTNGAAKLMIKGKTANGTVVTGSLNLTT